jgi:hypothetical protein
LKKGGEDGEGEEGREGKEAKEEFTLHLTRMPFLLNLMKPR